LRSRGSIRFRPATSSCWTASPPTLGRPLLGDDRVPRRLSPARPARSELPPPPSRGRRRRGGAGGRLAADRGRRLDRLSARAGQFFIWRFLASGRWWTAHPFSLSRAPDGRSLRITVKALGDHSARVGDIPVGTRVVAEGPFGVFTEAARRREKVLLIAGGIGITPIRALMEAMGGEIIVLYRAVNDDDLVFRAELDRLAAERGIELRYIVGDHATEEGSRLLSPAHLRELVPDIEDRDIFVCGPPAMTEAAVRNVRAAGIRRRHIHAERFAL
jgi:ferredoxin-NADP reductase